MRTRETWTTATILAGSLAICAAASAAPTANGTITATQTAGLHADQYGSYFYTVTVQWSIGCTDSQGLTRILNVDDSDSNTLLGEAFDSKTFPDGTLSESNSWVLEVPAGRTVEANIAVECATDLVGYDNETYTAAPLAFPAYVYPVTGVLGTNPVGSYPCLPIGNPSVALLRIDHSEGADESLRIVLTGAGVSYDQTFLGGNTDSANFEFTATSAGTVDLWAQRILGTGTTLDSNHVSITAAADGCAGATGNPDAGSGSDVDAGPGSPASSSKSGGGCSVVGGESLAGFALLSLAGLALSRRRRQ